MFNLCWILFSSVDLQLCVLNCTVALSSELCPKTKAYFWMSVKQMGLWGVHIRTRQSGRVTV